VKPQIGIASSRIAPASTISGSVKVKMKYFGLQAATDGERIDADLIPALF
jgi:hypothetical protein